MRKSIILLLLLLSTGIAQASIGMPELSDSLMQFTGFSRVWSPNVKVRKMRVDDNRVILYTNPTLMGVNWTPERVEEIKQKVSLWVLGHTEGDVEIFTKNINIKDLITNYSAKIPYNNKQKDLTDKHIALWPSHGLYYNRVRKQWIWQRATLWTTVEDLYSQEYVRLLRKMLENAGAVIHMPRANLEQNEAGPSGMPKWTEGARYRLMEQNLDSTLWYLYDGDEYKDDMKCRALWVNYLAGGSQQNPLEQGLGIPIELCLALHTDGLDSENDSTTIGTLCIYTAHDDKGNKTLANGKDRRTVNRDLADCLQTELVNDLRTIAPEWTRRQLHEANYCESRVPVVPSLIVEILSHKNMADMRYGLDPKFRFTAARALYKGILRYINGLSSVVQPLPIQQMAISPMGEITWEATIDSIEPTATPDYYLLYIQENDGEWSVQQIEQNYYKIDFKAGIQYNCYVVAGNDGGLSFPSPVLSAYISKRNKASMALIIDGFDDAYGPKWFADSTYAGIVPGSYACENYFTCAYIGQQWDFSRNSKWINDDNCGWGSSYRDHAGEIIIGNTHDYALMHGNVLKQLNISYVSTTAHCAKIDSTYHFVDYICGRQRKPFPQNIKEQLASYLLHGGKILASSDHISAIDKKWLAENLHVAFYAKNATRSGEIISNTKVFQIAVEPNTEQLFTAEAQALAPRGDGTEEIAVYKDMKCSAAIGWKQNDGEATTLIWGFPLEATCNFNKIYQYSIKWLLNK